MTRLHVSKLSSGVSKRYGSRQDPSAGDALFHTLKDVPSNPINISNTKALVGLSHICYQRHMLSATSIRQESYF